MSSRASYGPRPWVLAPLLALLAACSVPDEVNPVAIYNRISGRDDANRVPPPGMDRPMPNLATIPPRPERPSPEFRQAVTDALAADRARSRDPLALRTVPPTGAAATVPGGGSAMPAAPPPRPALANAPRIPWAEAPAAPAAPAGRAGSAAPAAAVPEMPQEAPAAPPPDLLGPPPRPR